MCLKKLASPEDNSIPARDQNTLTHLTTLQLHTDHSACCALHIGKFVATMLCYSIVLLSRSHIQPPDELWGTHGDLPTRPCTRHCSPDRMLPAKLFASDSFFHVRVGCVLELAMCHKVDKPSVGECLFSNFPPSFSGSEFLQKG